MKNDPKIDLGMTGYAELFLTEEQRKEQKLLRILDVPMRFIDEFPNHPFQVRMDVKTYAYDMEHFRVDVEVPVSNVFYSWVFGFGGKVWIQGPKNVKQEFIDMIQQVSKVSQES